MPSRNTLPLLGLLLVGGSSLAACNSLTGIDDLFVGKGGGSQGTGAGAGGSAAQAGAGGGSVASSGGPSGTSSTSTGVPGGMLLAANGITITEIALYQGVKRDLMTNGAPATSKTSVVAGRDALVRVFYKVAGQYDGSPVTAHLTLGTGSTPITVTATPSGTSSDAALNSTINFEVPGAALVAGLSFRVDLLQPFPHSAGGNAGAVFPATGLTPMGVVSDGAGPLKIKIVPVKYGADGSNRLPDTSAGQLDMYKQRFYAIYPVDSVEVTARAPFAWGSQVSPNGSGWSELLDAVTNLRQQDGAPPDVYYFGAFAPAGTMDQFCGGGCVAGLGSIGGPSDTVARAAIGLGFSGPEAGDTAVHEIGHNHGRNHSPCGGAQGVDPNYPYPNAQIGVWGYDIVTKQLQPPTTTTDLMGYCQPIWISDYTYDAFFERIKIVNGAQIVYPADLLDRTYERARVDGEGNLTWLTPWTLHLPPEAESKTLTLSGPEGVETVTAQFYPYDHLPGGVLMWPAAKPSVTQFEVEIAGKVGHLARP